MGIGVLQLEEGILRLRFIKSNTKSGFLGFESEYEPSVASALTHGQHARGLIQREVGMLFCVPVEFLVRQIPVVQVADIDTSNLRVG